MAKLLCPGCLAPLGDEADDPSPPALCPRCTAEPPPHLRGVFIGRVTDPAHVQGHTGSVDSGADATTGWCVVGVMPKPRGRKPRRPGSP